MQIRFGICDPCHNLMSFFHALSPSYEQLNNWRNDFYSKERKQAPMAKKSANEKKKDLAFPERDLTEVEKIRIDRVGPVLRMWRKVFPPGPLKASQESVTIFTRQFAVLLQAGVPLVQAFDSFQDPNENVHRAIYDIGGRVQAGHRLSQALRGYPKIFSPLYCGLVESGERTGQLIDVLNKLADDLEKSLKMRRKLVAALTYPAILMISAVLCVTFFVTTVLPMLEPMFTQMHIQLPFATRVLLHSKEVLLWTVGVSTVVFTAGFLIYKSLAKDPVMQRLFHKLVLFVPLFGPLFKIMTITRVLQALATMLDVGMTMVHAFQSCETLTTNKHLCFQIAELRRSVIDGNTVAESMRHIPLFPRSTVQLITVGEESSNIIQMLQFASRILEEDFDASVDQLANNLEPVIMMVMGVVVGFIVLGAMLPIVQLLQNL